MVLTWQLSHCLYVSSYTVWLPDINPHMSTNWNRESSVAMVELSINTSGCDIGLWQTSQDLN